MKSVIHLLAAGIIVVSSLGLAACESEMAQKVPSDARPVASGTGATSYRTAEDGTIYVYDKTWNKLVYTGDVNANEMVKVDPMNSRVTVDGRPVVEQTPLGSGDQFEILLDPHTIAGHTTTIERKTVIERENND